MFVCAPSVADQLRVMVSNKLRFCCTEELSEAGKEGAAEPAQPAWPREPPFLPALANGSSASGTGVWSV